jgi:hypothetical protein
VFLVRKNTNLIDYTILRVLGVLVYAVLSPPVLVPYFDRLHATLLCKRVFDSKLACLTLCFSLAAAVEAAPYTTLLHQAEALVTVDCASRLFFSFVR